MEDSNTLKKFSELEKLEKLKDLFKLIEYDQNKKKKYDTKEGKKFLKNIVGFYDNLIIILAELSKEINNNIKNDENNYLHKELIDIIKKMLACPGTPTVIKWYLKLDKKGKEINYKSYSKFIFSQEVGRKRNKKSLTDDEINTCLNNINVKIPSENCTEIEKWADTKKSIITNDDIELYIKENKLSIDFKHDKYTIRSCLKNIKNKKLVITKHKVKNNVKNEDGTDTDTSTSEDLKEELAVDTIAQLGNESGLESLPTSTLTPTSPTPTIQSNPTLPNPINYILDTFFTNLKGGVNEDCSEKIKMEEQYPWLKVTTLPENKKAKTIIIDNNEQNFKK
jgi:hypothetical protein